MSRWATKGLLHFANEVEADRLSSGEGTADFLRWVLPRVETFNISEAKDDGVRGVGDNLTQPLTLEELETLDNNELMTLSLVISAIRKF